MNILVFSDEYMYQGLLALINSIIKNGTTKENIILHIFVENKKFVKLLKTIDNIDKISYTINILTKTTLLENDKLKPIYEAFLDIKNHLVLNNVVCDNYNLFNLGRLLIPELLPDVDKCMYLDSDMIVLSDLSEVYDNFVPKDDNFFAAVVNVKGKCNRRCPVFKEKYRKGRFINTQGGIFITDLSYWRKNNVLSLVEAILQDHYNVLSNGGRGLYAKDSFTQAVQDIVFNQFEITLISKLYNIITKEKDFRKPDNGGPTEEDYKNGANIGLRDNTIRKWEKYRFHDDEIKILHFKGPHKPWKKSKKIRIHLDKYLKKFNEYHI